MERRALQQNNSLVDRDFLSETRMFFAVLAIAYVLVGTAVSLREDDEQFLLQKKQQGTTQEAQANNESITKGQK